MYTDIVWAGKARRHARRGLRTGLSTDAEGAGSDVARAVTPRRPEAECRSANFRGVWRIRFTPMARLL